MKRFTWRLVLLGLVCLAVYLPGFVRMGRSRRQLTHYRTQAELLVEQNRLFREEIQRLKDDPLLNEKLAREELGLIREGEWIIKER